MQTFILCDDKLKKFKEQFNVKYDYILLQIDYDNKKASYIVEDAVRFDINYDLAIKYI